MLNVIPFDYKENGIDEIADVTFEYPSIYNDIIDDFITIIEVDIYPRNNEYIRKTYLPTAFPEWQIDEWKSTFFQELQKYLPEPHRCYRR